MTPSFDAYLRAFRGVSVAVLGIGVSNTPLIRLLADAGAHVTACDRKTRAALGPVADELAALGVELRCGPDYLAHLTQQRIYRTPGMRPDLPALVRARENGAVVTSEIEDFLSVCPCPVIGVTGSDGKTTTTSLIAEMLRAEGMTVHLGGNIGRPLLADTGRMTPGDTAVLELSSFQLMTLSTSPATAVITNVTPNHLDVHLSMEEYMQAKENIFRHQDKSGLVVLNADCAHTRTMAQAAPGRARLFSRTAPLPEGVSLQDGTLVVREDGRCERLFAAREIRLPGTHNVENYLAACAALYGRVRPEVMARIARDFAGVPHRIELVAEVGGVRCYNDSIASSPTRTLAGLRAFTQKVILIAGGYDKHIPFDDVGPAAAAHVKSLILIGATAGTIRAAVAGVPGAPPIADAGELARAVEMAFAQAEPGDIILLSPACASFDQFPNFEARGNRFKELVLARAMARRSGTEALV
ncbi:MAG: UDP-N-acetylmuramoyl-L-alanine--D-glutamate ligase [Oscillospiraceae bacterium]|jgi:UDP-N-acetylmuramoylalanine--D-glutamate ligase|nr:UDP-N-acetylmuramoyl-L-alanine--D-glutamate ligase [Oscillospiraceae bacterium]